MTVVTAIVAIRRLHFALVHGWAALARCALAAARAISVVLEQAEPFTAGGTRWATAVIAYDARIGAPVCAASAGPFGQRPHSEHT